MVWEVMQDDRRHYNRWLYTAKAFFDSKVLVNVHLIDGRVLTGFISEISQCVQRDLFLDESDLYPPPNPRYICGDTIYMISEYRQQYPVFYRNKSTFVLVDNFRKSQPSDDSPQQCVCNFSIRREGGWKTLSTELPTIYLNEDNLFDQICDFINDWNESSDSSVKIEHLDSCYEEEYEKIREHREREEEEREREKEERIRKRILEEIARKRKFRKIDGHLKDDHS